MAPQVVRKSEAPTYIRRWLAEKGGVENDALLGCFCGKYRLRSDDNRCTDLEHYSEEVTFRCGVYSTRKTKLNVPYLCHKADKDATFTIEDYVVEGLCPKCPHSSQDYQRDMLRQHTRRQSSDFKKINTEDESQDMEAIKVLRYDLSEGVEALKRRGVRLVHFATEIDVATDMPTTRPTTPSESKKH
ncbi:hypothetical protein F5Y14DRAFT_463110 [Nemania sp. NC0429]|nr:hypothetical protein F5Y14DRAFT_463110 [Nemania sp. NC0429]